MIGFGFGFGFAALFVLVFFTGRIDSKHFALVALSKENHGIPLKDC